MGRQAPPLPPWSWTDLELTLEAVADTPAREMLLSHFLTGLRQDLPQDPKAVLEEIIHIALLIANLDEPSPGSGLRLDQPYLGSS